MKNLIYSTALLCAFLFIASCKKDGLTQPQSDASVQTQKELSSVSVQPACDSTKLVNFVLYNSTGIPSYQIVFSGPKAYTFVFPANGLATIAVKPGTYTVFVYSPETSPAHTFYLNNLNGVKQPGIKYDGISISPCSAAQSVTIAE